MFEGPFAVTDILPEGFVDADHALGIVADRCLSKKIESIRCAHEGKKNDSGDILLDTIIEQGKMLALRGYNEEVFTKLRIEAAHELRKILYTHPTLRAYCFGRDGQTEIDPKQWILPQANGVLEAGIAMPSTISLFGGRIGFSSEELSAAFPVKAAAVFRPVDSIADDIDNRCGPKKKNVEKATEAAIKKEAQQLLVTKGLEEVQQLLSDKFHLDRDSVRTIVKKSPRARGERITPTPDKSANSNPRKSAKSSAENPRK